MTGLWKNTVPLHLVCGVCKAELTTEVVTLGERRDLIERFDEAHAACREREAKQT